MGKIFRISTSIVIVALLLFGNPARAFACSCVGAPPPLDALANSDAVFAGRVVAVVDTNPGPHINSADPLRATFQVKTVWKGGAVPTLFVASARNGATCGFPFEQGRDYLIYANSRDGVLETNICTRSTFLNQAQADLAALGAGQAVAAAAPEAFSISPWLIVVGIVGVILMVILFGAGLVTIQKKDS